MSDFAITECINLVFLAKIKKFCAFGRRGFSESTLAEFCLPPHLSLSSLGGLDRAVVARLADGYQVGLRPEQRWVAIVALPMVDDQPGGVVVAMPAAFPLAGIGIPEQDIHPKLEPSGRAMLVAIVGG